MRSLRQEGVLVGLEVRINQPIVGSARRRRINRVEAEEVISREEEEVVSRRCIFISRRRRGTVIATLRLRIARPTVVTSSTMTDVVDRVRWITEEGDRRVVVLEEGAIWLRGSASRRGVEAVAGVADRAEVQHQRTTARTFDLEFAIICRIFSCAGITREDLFAVESHEVERKVHSCDIAIHFANY